MPSAINSACSSAPSNGLGRATWTRGVWVLLSRLWANWSEALIIVKPATVIALAPGRCDAEGDCTSRTVTPDGRVVVRQPAQATMTLSDSDWLDLAWLIDGSELRARLRDGLECNDANEGSTTPVTLASLMRESRAL